MSLYVILATAAVAGNLAASAIHSAVKRWCRPA